MYTGTFNRQVFNGQSEVIQCISDSQQENAYLPHLHSYLASSYIVVRHKPNLLYVASAKGQGP